LRTGPHVLRQGYAARRCGRRKAPSQQPSCLLGVLTVTFTRLNTRARQNLARHNRIQHNGVSRNPRHHKTPHQKFLFFAHAHRGGAEYGAHPVVRWRRPARGSHSGVHAGRVATSTLRETIHPTDDGCLVQRIKWFQ